ncbi:hypothetical protein Tco_0750557 [Tanacetum coccineum]|uniref:Uncharacterized protein n=1 Tax=Tanacetum coccineum TaxID=301880 RepID=A0ABQ4Z477_9ASTR
MNNRFSTESRIILALELRMNALAMLDSRLIRDDTRISDRYVFDLNGGAIDWKVPSKVPLQKSATELKYIARVRTHMEAV